EGRDTSRLSRRELALIRNQKLGFVFQGFNLLKRYSALDNVELPLLYAGVPARDRRSRALEMLELVGLAGRADHTPNQLSGGERQRGAIARARATGPRLLVADEPTGNLDSRTGEEILAALERLNRGRGQTILMVTHDNAVADRADRQVTVRDGLIDS